MGPPETPTIHITPQVDMDQEPVSKMDIPEPVFTLGPSEPKPEPQDVLIGCIKVDIYSQSSGVTGNVEEEDIQTDSRSKPDIGGSEADSRVPRLWRSKGTDSPPPEDCHLFLCEVCEEEYNEEVFLLKHKLDDHGMPIEMSLTHLPGHKTCGNCFKYLSESVEQNVAVFLTKPCAKCNSSKCYSCELCNSHFYLLDHFKIALNMLKHNMPNPKSLFQKMSACIKPHTNKQRQKKVQDKKKARQKIKPIRTEDTRGAAVNERREKLCSQCGKTFSNRKDFMRHLMRVHPQEMPFGCNACNYSFLSEADLTAHLRHGTEEKPFICGECGRRFPERNEFIYHCLSHNIQTKKFWCDLCPKGFFWKGDLQCHIKSHHGSFVADKKTSDEAQRQNDTNTGPCDGSGQGTLSRGCPLTLGDKHRRFRFINKHGPFEFVCEICGKRCKHRSGLKEHIRTHTGELPLQCEVCGNSFSNSSHHRTHFERLHMERTIPCSECGKLFATQRHLKRHCDETHEAKKSFKCEECSMAFVSQRHLTRHMYRHTRKSPHICEHCGRGFSTATYCRIHQKKCLI